MSLPDYEAYIGSHISGETDLLELMQLCTSLSSNNSVSPQACSTAERETQHSTIDIGFLDVASVQFDDDHPAFDFAVDTPPQLFSPGRAQTKDIAVQLHAQRCKEVEELGIRLDISTPLATCMRNHSSYPVLEPQLRNELVVIYFDHVHPLCPVIDEQNFWWHFIALSEDEFFDLFPAIMLNAMLFAAFGHATDEQVRRSGFSSVDEVQSRYFYVLGKIYDDAHPQVLCEMGEVVLAKTSLLLSLWSPPKLEINLSSLWADRAMYHTKRHLHRTSPNRSMPMPKRRDILVWCCITRNTFISYSMHRPYRPCMEEPLCDPNDVRSEFDRELQFHNFCSSAAKVRMVDDFITMCKLSQNLRNILYLQRNMLSSIQDAECSPSTQDVNQAELHNCLSRYLQTAKAESDLVDLIELHDLVKCRSTDRVGGERASELVAARTRSYVLQIMVFSCIVSLYQFTISAESSPWARSCYRTALSKLLDASKKVACIVEHMLSDVPIEAIPGNIISWTISPMLPLLVDQNCSKFGLPGLSFDSDSDSDSETDDSDDNEDLDCTSTGREMTSLLELTRRMAPRFHSARDALALLQNADHILCLNAASAESTAGTTSTGGSVAGDFSVAERRGSWDLLIKAMRFVESETADSGGGALYQ